MSEEGEVPSISAISQEYERRKGISLSDAVDYIIQEQELIIKAVRTALEYQLIKFSPPVFAWLYNCVKASKGNKKLFLFVTQFTPDLTYLYLHCSVDNLKELKTATEALLKGIIAETISVSPIQVPDLTRPSIYHQTTSSVSPSSLTVAALTQHNQTESPSNRTLFTITDIVTGANRLLFIITVILPCTDNITLYPLVSIRMYCHISTMLVVRGMNTTFIAQMSDYSSKDQCVSMVTLTSLSKEKRFPVNDEFISVLLHGVQMCLCQACHFEANQSLQALKLRCQYEVFPLSMQISLALERLAVEMNPLKLPFDTESYKTYSSKDNSNWPSRPITILRYFTGQILHHHLNNEDICYESESLESLKELSHTQQPLEEPHPPTREEPHPPTREEPHPSNIEEPHPPNREEEPHPPNREEEPHPPNREEEPISHSHVTIIVSSEVSSSSESEVEMKPVASASISSEGNIINNHKVTSV